MYARNGVIHVVDGLFMQANEQDKIFEFGVRSAAVDEAFEETTTVRRPTIEEMIFDAEAATAQPVIPVSFEIQDDTETGELRSL